MVLRAEQVDFAYRRGRPVLRGVGIDLPTGAMTAIVGPNGSGKSTLLRLLLGILEPGAGRVLLEGRPIHQFSPRERARRIAYVAQRPRLEFGFSVRQAVGLGCFATGSADGTVRAALTQMDVLDLADEPFALLSVGQQQRVALARALAQLRAGAVPGALLADEPTSAMDPAHVVHAMETLTRVAGQDHAVGVVLHDLGLAARYAHRVLVLDATGRVAGAGSADQTLVPERLEPVFGIAFERVRRDGRDIAIVPVGSEPGRL